MLLITVTTAGWLDGSSPQRCLRADLGRLLVLGVALTVWMDKLAFGGFAVVAAAYLAVNAAFLFGLARERAAPVPAT